MTNLLMAAGFGALAGALSSAVVSVLLTRRRRCSVDPEPGPADPFVEAEIDQAAVAWAKQHDQPDQAAAVMADKLKLLHRLGTNRGWLR